MSRNMKMRPDHKDPEFTGKATVAGVEYYISAWINERKDGSGKFFGMKFKPVNANRVAPPPQPESLPSNGGNDDVPF